MLGPTCHGRGCTLFLLFFLFFSHLLYFKVIWKAGFRREVSLALSKLSSYIDPISRSCDPISKVVPKIPWLWLMAANEFVAHKVCNVFQNQNNGTKQKAQNHEKPWNHPELSKQTTKKKYVTTERDGTTRQKTWNLKKNTTNRGTTTNTLIHGKPCNHQRPWDQ